MYRLVFALGLLLGMMGSAQAEHEFTGMTPSGAYYRIAVPDGWKSGDSLVLFQHGLTFDPAQPDSLQQHLDLGPLAELQLSEGYALAASSYSQRSWALFTAAQSASAAPDMKAVSLNHVTVKVADVQRTRGHGPAPLRACPSMTSPARTSTPPATRPTRSPRGTTFSTSTNAAIAATHSRFITPATNSKAMRNQQHPTQYMPCRSPIMMAPRRPSRQSVIRNPKGERQCARQVYFRGVH